MQCAYAGRSGARLGNAKSLFPVTSWALREYTFKDIRLRAGSHTDLNFICYHYRRLLLISGEQLMTTAATTGMVSKSEVNPELGTVLKHSRWRRSETRPFVAPQDPRGAGRPPHE